MTTLTKKQCKKCHYEQIDRYYDDDGVEFVPSHYCYDNTYYSATENKWYHQE